MNEASFDQPVSAIELRGRNRIMEGPAFVKVGDTTLVCAPFTETLTPSGKPENVVYVMDGQLAGVGRAYQRVTFGRSERENRLVVSDEKASEVHGYVEPLGNNHFLVGDNASLYGTKVTPMHELSSTPIDLSSSDSPPFVLKDTPVKLRLGTAELLVRKDTAGNVTIDLPDGSTYKLADASTTARTELRIGRSPKDNDIVLDDKTVSRKHAKIIWAAGVMQIVDVGSTQHTEAYALPSKRPANSPATQTQRARQEEVEQPPLGAVVGVSEMKGRRSTMEDTHIHVYPFGGERRKRLVAVFDGHANNPIGGARAAQIASRILPDNILIQMKRHPIEIDAIKRAFVVTDEQLAETGNIVGGTTAAIALLDGSRLITANVGDTHIVLDHSGEAVQLTENHGVYNLTEWQRAQAAGWTIENGYFTRPDGSKIMISRSLGDHALGPLISAEPAIHQRQLTAEDRRLIIGSDGLFNVVSQPEAVELIKNIQDPQQASDLLKNEAFRRGSLDNITVMVVNLR